MKWFKHDSNANMDDKLQEVLLDYGLEGYGLYWYCIELITNRVSEDNLTFELKHDARIIARNTGSTAQKVEEMMKSFVRLGLFENSQGTITCFKLARRLDKSMTSNPEMRKLIGNLKNHDSIMTQSGKVMQEETRLDKNRLDKSIEESTSCNSTKSRLPNCPHKEILKLWSEIMPDKPQPITWDGERPKALAARWKSGFVKNIDGNASYTDLDSGLKWWRDFFEWQRHSHWLINEFKGFDIGWLVKLENFNKVRQGNYHS
jgi:hypothetical protein